VIIKIPLSLRRRWVYSTNTDDIQPLRRWWICNIRYRNAGLFREVVARFGVQYL